MFAPKLFAACLVLSAGSLLTSDLVAQHLFINRGTTAADALAFEHAVKKLAARDTQMQTLNSGLKELASRAEKFTWLAQRQGSYYALQREFANITTQYTLVRDTIETAADWAQGHPRRQEWRDVQVAFDRVYYNLYGYDLLDPYFGRHPDFAATPAPLRIPRETLRQPMYEPNKYARPYPLKAAPATEPSDILWRSRGTPRQF